MPTCELITIGSELLSGSALNTNAQFLAQRISALDIEVVRQVSCRDREEDILSALSLASSRSDLIIATGGLGPTPDDITREAVARFFHCGLKFDRAQYQEIIHHFRVLHRTAPLMTRREAYLPEVAKPLRNRFGIALGFYVEQAGRLFVVLPGVPGEVVKMYETAVQTLIKRKFPNRVPIYPLEARIAGLYETQIMRKLGSRFFSGRAFEFGIYPEIGDVIIRIKTKGKSLIPILRRELVKALGERIYSFDGKALPLVVGEALIKRKKTLAVAESCTGGLLAARLTDIPGASRYVKGGVIVYSNQSELVELGLEQKLIRAKGAVSFEVAKSMAEAIRFKYQTSIGVSITGIAGPSGGTFLKPVGLVYFGISDSKATRVFKSRFLGDRQKVRLQAVQKVLFLLLQWLSKP